MSTYPYRLATLSKPGCPPFPALVKDEHAIALRALRPLALLLGYPLVGVDDMATLLGHWAVNQPALQQVAQHLNVATHPLATPVGALRIEAPVQPTQVFCTIGNYRAQVIEATVDAHLSKGGSQH
ncbi:hypothetical protein LZ023_23130 [Pseudomonas silvicola]|nr:hypothetical protein LZ023_23130 [Pseudomonas silvicola]